MLEPHEHQVVRALYHALGELPEAEWRAIVAKADLAPAVRGELEALLGHQPSVGAFAEERMGEAGARLFAAAGRGQGAMPDGPHADPGPPVDLGVGRTIDGFRVDGVLGRGGMGVVYRASQEQPRREVALKVIRGFDFDGAARRRFEYEAQILARMDHPCVAKVYQAGIDRSTHEETPYIAMELVDGVDLLEHFGRTGGGLEERLEVFEQVCAGVEHAHQRGVVHRDLKPANILVSEDGRPRILDFGIARPLQADEGSTPGRTRTGAVLGSLAWMSPEQARGALGQIDVRSDVYSLGLILFHLLAGRLPYEVGVLEPWQAAQAICETEPERLGRVRPELRGDLELIVAMALEKEPDRRYPSVGALAKDVRRYLEDQPIEARPWSVSYQLRKFARRHRLLVGAALALFVTVAIGFASGLYLWQRSERALETARMEALTSARVERFLIETFAEENPYEEGSGAAAGERRTVKEVVDRASATIGDELPDEPLVRARLMATLGQVYSALGLWSSAIRMLEGALAARRGALGASHLESIDAELALGVAYMRADRFGEAETTLSAAVDGRSAALGAEHPSTLEAALQLGMLYSTQARYDEAEELLTENLAMWSSSEVEGRAIALVALGTLCMDAGRPAEAEARFREGLELRRRSYGAEHPELLLTASNLAAALMLQDRIDEAIALQTEVLEVARRVLGEEHPYTLRTLINIGAAHERAGRLAEAEALLREAIARTAEPPAATSSQRVAALQNLAGILKSTGRFEEARAIYDECLEAAPRVWGPEHPHTLTIIHNVGALYVQLGRDEEALVHLREAFTVARRRHGEDHPSTSGFRASLGSTLERVLARSRRERGPGDSRTLAWLVELADLRREAGQHELAEAGYLEALDASARTLDAGRPEPHECLEGLARLYRDQGRLEEAASLATELLDATPDDAPERAAREELLDAILAELDGDG